MRKIFSFLFIYIGWISALQAQVCTQYAAGPYSDQGAISEAGCNAQVVQAAYQAWCHEIYYSDVVSGGTYNIKLAAPGTCGNGAWGGAPFVTVIQGGTASGGQVTGGTVIASGNCCGLGINFTATVTGTVWFIFNTATGTNSNCTAPVVQTDNGTPTLTTISGVACGVCGDATCNVGENYCSCNSDCFNECDFIWVDWIGFDSIGTPFIDTTFSFFCGGDLGFPNSIVIPVAITTDIACVGAYDVSIDNGYLRQLDGMPVDTISDYFIFWMVLNDAATSTADSIIDITVTDVSTGFGGCSSVNSMLNVAGFLPSSICTCPDTMALNYIESYTLDYVANNIIQSTDTIEAGANIDHEAGIFVDLLAGFWAKSGCTFAAFIGACDSAGGIVAKMGNFLSPTPYQEGLKDVKKVNDKKIPRKIGSKAAKSHSSNAIAAISTLNVSPNPVADMAWVQFSLPQTTKASVELFDMQGRLVKTLFTGETTGTQVSINTGELTSGLYLVKMQSAYGQESVRLMVK
ncbi:MAG: T9SS type A sorting domain-containing protein [Sphingobacteriales bacterium]|nr:T9SS type A sorting domain-containing protein [Sphingobacteriales bacterium]